MKSSILVSILLLKMLASNTDSITINFPNIKESPIGEGTIVCYHCFNSLLAQQSFIYNSKPYVFSKNGTCAKHTDGYDIEDEAKFYCGITILHTKDPVYESITPKEETVFKLKFSSIKKEHCIAAKAQKNKDIVCANSNCKKILMCCETSFCNIPENYKLLGVAAYSDKTDKNLKNSYNKYTDSECLLTSQALTETRYQECILASYNSSASVNIYNRSSLDIDNRPPCNLSIKTDNMVDSFLILFTTLIYYIYN